jgi:hypothetical protein
MSIFRERAGQAAATWHGEVRKIGGAYSTVAGLTADPSVCAEQVFRTPFVNLNRCLDHWSGVARVDNRAEYCLSFLGRARQPTLPPMRTVKGGTAVCSRFILNFIG